MIADLVIVLDEGVNPPFEIAGQVVVVEQDAVLQRLVPARQKNRSRLFDERTNISALWEASDRVLC